MKRIAAIVVINLIFFSFLSLLDPIHPSISAAPETRNITLENRSVTEAVKILGEIAAVAIELEGPLPDDKLNKVFSHRSLEESLSRILQPLDYVIIWGMDGVVTVIVGQSLSSLKQSEADAGGASESGFAGNDYEPSLSESELVPPSERDPAADGPDAAVTAAVTRDEYSGNFDIVPPSEDGSEEPTYFPSSDAELYSMPPDDHAFDYERDVPPDEELQLSAPAVESVPKDDDWAPIPSLSEDELVPYTEAPLFDDRAAGADGTEEPDSDADLVPPD